MLLNYEPYLTVYSVCRLLLIKVNPSHFFRHWVLSSKMFTVFQETLVASRGITREKEIFAQI
jgi:hypothetical protein